MNVPPKIPNDPRDIKTIREFLTDVRQQMCGLADYLSEPWKGHFNTLKAEYDKALADLPPTDMVPAAQEASYNLRCFYSCLANANCLASMLGTSLQSMIGSREADVKVALNSAVDAAMLKQITDGLIVKKADVDAQVEAALKARTEAGELVPKATLLQLCSDAKTAGIAEGEKKVRDDVTAKATRTAKISERKGILQTCGLPLPAATLEDILGGTEDEFKAAQKLAEERIAALAKKGIALNSRSAIGQNVWLGQADWERYEALATEVLSQPDVLKVPPAAGTPGGPPKGMIA